MEQSIRRRPRAGPPHSRPPGPAPCLDPLRISIQREHPDHAPARAPVRTRLGQLIARDAPVDLHYALATIFEIMDVGSRADLKSDC
jgi:hypothetical protein